MSFNNEAPHVDLNLPTPGFDTNSSPSSTHNIRSSNPNGSSFQNNHSTPANGNSIQNARDTVVNCKQAMASVQDHPVTQNVKDTVYNGPVGETVKDQSVKTSNEFKDLANSRTIPDHRAATGQKLTHYHSMFYRLLSWKNPRATAITFAINVALIFAGRYLNIARYVLKGLYIVLGLAAAAEIAGNAVLGDGLTSRMRPRNYFVIPKESLERFLDDFHQLINFAVIEFQRILFAENVWVTVGAFLASFASYFLIKWLPFWGLALIYTSAIYLGPLVYIKNKDVIDANLNHAGNLVKQQSSQVKDLAAHHTGRAADTVRTYAGEYTQKAQSMVGQSRQKIPDITGSNSNSNNLSTGSQSTNNPLKNNDLTGSSNLNNGSPSISNPTKHDDSIGSRNFSSGSSIGNPSKHDDSIGSRNFSNGSSLGNPSQHDDSTGSRNFSNGNSSIPKPVQDDDFPAAPRVEPFSHGDIPARVPAYEPQANPPY
ncbi:hypothetical protein EJ08DRAFT_578216 [Tothia fuscella]|uniref:Reticulon-like protein n=1 Tax=Tothia fuscella TaxID=1048955 RepID=A0A9P4P351_9PEZI|nr:hypothetical protein EJ08DRAFT_578216 [Tothia fuscella]